MDHPLGFTPGETTLADVVEDVFQDLQASVPLATIAIAVRRCRRELDIGGGPAEPELIRALALERLRSRRYGVSQKIERTGVPR